MGLLYGEQELKLHRSFSTWGLQSSVTKQDRKIHNVGI